LRLAKVDEQQADVDQHQRQPKERDAGLHRVAAGHEIRHRHRDPAHVQQGIQVGLGHLSAEQPLLHERRQRDQRNVAWNARRRSMKACASASPAGCRAAG
jgi:hypothetical protein